MATPYHASISFYIGNYRLYTNKDVQKEGEPESIPAHLYIRTFLINKWLQINRRTTAATTKNKSLQNFHFDQTLLKFMVQKFITLTKVKVNPFFFFMEIQLLHTYGET